MNFTTVNTPHHPVSPPESFSLITLSVLPGKQVLEVLGARSVYLMQGSLPGLEPPWIGEGRKGVGEIFKHFIKTK